MRRFSRIALLAVVATIVVVLNVGYANAAPMPDDDKADEMKIVSAMDIDREIKPKTDNPANESDKEPVVQPAGDDTSDHIQVIKMEHLSKQELKEIEELEKEIVKEYHFEPNGEIWKNDNMTAENQDEGENTKKITEIRGPRNMKNMPPEQTKPTNGLTDKEITEIIQMITFPKTEDTVTVAEEKKRENEPEPRVVTEEESQTEGKIRTGRAIRSHSRGYYILAFAPVEGAAEPQRYTKLDIIPIERSVNENAGDDYDEAGLQSANSSDDYEEGRLITRKQLSRYIRNMMRQIRKGTRKVDRKTRVKSADAEDPTVENFLRKLYQTRKVQEPTAKKGSWFDWSQQT